MTEREADFGPGATDAAVPVAGDRRLDDLHAQAEAWVNENVASRKAHPNSTAHQARRVALEEAANTVLNVVEGRLTGLAEHYARQGKPETAEEDDPRLTLPVVVEFLGSANDRWHRWALRPDESTAAEVVRTLLPRVHAVRVHRGECGGSEPSSERPAVASDTQGAAPTRAVYVRLAEGGLDSTTEPVDNVRIDWSCTPADGWAPVGVEVLGASGVEIDGEDVLRGGDADGSGEGETDRPITFQTDRRTGERNRHITCGTVRVLPRDLLPIVVDTYDEDIQVDPDDARDLALTLLAALELPALSEDEALALPYSVREEVTGDRAVSAPLGTKLGAKKAAVAAVHTVNGWSVTGMGREQDHEAWVRLNQWVVLALGEGSES